MGNYCCAEQQTEAQKKYKKTCVLTPKTTHTNNKSSDCLDSLDKEDTFLRVQQNPHKRMLVDPPEIKDFQLIGELGKGGQGEVFQVCYQGPTNRSSCNGNLRENSIYALKRVPKVNNQNRRKSMILGSCLLLSNNCPFLMNGLLAYENDSYMYEVMEVAAGGDLSTFLETTRGKGDLFRNLGQQGIRMVLAGIILGLQYLHQRNYIYCDLKIDNVLIKQDGYPQLSDLGLIQQGKCISLDNFDGTLSYAAPQFFISDKVDKSIDLWSLGILLYTLTYGEMPYDPQDITDGDFIETAKMKDKKYGLKRKRVSKQLLDLINSLLRFEPSKRIGFSSFDEIKNHSFFKDFDWKQYEKKQMKNPIADIVSIFEKKKKNKKRKVSYQEVSQSQDYFGINERVKINKKPIKCDLFMSQQLNNH